MKYVLLILLGGTGTPLAVFAIARALVERHADRTAAEIRAQHARPMPGQSRPAADRPKELTR